MADVVGIDVAFAQATQTLQQRQQPQAALYDGMGAMYMPQYYPYHPGQRARERAARLDPQNKGRGGCRRIKTHDK